MTQTPAKQFLILLSGMLLLAIPLSLLTWASPSAPVKVIEPTTPEGTKNVFCYLEVYSTTPLVDFSITVDEKIIAHTSSLPANESVEFEIDISQDALENSSFQFVGNRSDDQNSKAAIEIILTPETSDAIERTLWFRDQLNANFIF